MADNYSLCFVGAMDRLWFHQSILFSERMSLLCPKTLKPPQQPISESFTYASSSLSLSPLPADEENSSDSSPIQDEEILSDSSAVTPQDDCNKEEEEKEINLKERPTRLNLITSRARSYSLLPSTQKRKNLRYSVRRLSKSMSCRSLGELELEEVKGFMDLGFIFKKEHLSPWMMGVVPGLQRLGLLYKNKQNTKLNYATEAVKDDEIEEEEEKRDIMRPYLSEAWLIKRPDSPLLNLRVPRVSATEDMKEHLKFWARTVASEIQQES